MNHLQNSFDPDADYNDEIRCQFDLDLVTSKVYAMTHDHAAELGFDSIEDLLRQIAQDFCINE